MDERDPYSFTEHLAGQGRMARWHAEQLANSAAELSRRLNAGHRARDLDRVVKDAIRQAHDALFFLTRIEHARMMQSQYDVDQLRPAPRRAKRMGKS